MTTFTKGDRVEFTQNYMSDVKTGDQGTITSIDLSDDLAEVKLDKGVDTAAFTYRFRKVGPYSTFKVGDRVEFLEDYTWVFKGNKGKVTAVNESFPASENGLVTVKMDGGASSTVYGKRLKLEKVKAAPKFKVGDRVTVIPNSGYIYPSHADKPLVVLHTKGAVYGVGAVGNDASKAHASEGWLAYPEDRLEAYKPTFVVGDYVEVWGYDPNSSWEGKQGEVVSANYYVHVQPENGLPGGFHAHQLRKVARPVFKVGDWVEVKNHSAGWDGTQGEVIKLPTNVFEDDRITIKPVNGDRLYFYAKSLVKAERPKPKALSALEKSSFKKGDKVTVVNNLKGKPEEVALVKNTEGKHGVIVGSSQNFILVDVEGRVQEHDPYRAEELTLYKPTALEKAGLKVGDHVRPTASGKHFSSNFDKFGGTVTDDGTSRNYIRVELASGTTLLMTPNEIEKGEAVPAFKDGDWVEVTNYGSYDGTQGEIKGRAKWSADRFKIVTEKGVELVFRPENLKAAAKPFPKFKVGDFVEVIKGGHTGVKTEIVSIGEYPSFNYYRLVINGVTVSFRYEELKLTERNHPLLEKAGVKVGDKVRAKSPNIGGLTEDFHAKGGTVTGAAGYIHIDVTDGGTVLALPGEIELGLPVVKTWTEKAEIGDTYVTKDSKGKVVRFLSKVGENKWTRKYPSTSSVHENLSNSDIAYYAEDEYYNLTKI